MLHRRRATVHGACDCRAIRPRPGASAACFAKTLVDKQPALMEAANLLQRGCAPPRRVLSNDLPHDVTDQRLRCARVAALERLVSLKDDVVRALLDESRDGFVWHAASSAELHRVSAMAEATQGEVTQWAAAAAEAESCIGQLRGELGVTRQTAFRLSKHNQQLREQNEQLHLHCECLRRALSLQTLVP